MEALVNFQLPPLDEKPKDHPDLTDESIAQSLYETGHYAVIAQLEPGLAIVGEKSKPVLPYTIELSATPEDPNSHHRWKATAEEAQKIAGVRDAIMGIQKRQPPRPYNPPLRWDPVDLQPSEPFED